VSRPLSSRYAVYLLGLLTTLNFFNYVDRLVINSMFPSLRAHFGFSDPQLGMIANAFFLVHALTTVPFGWMADRYNRRVLMASAVLLWSLATVASGYALGFLSLLFLRSLVGIGEAAYGPVSTALLAESFPTGKKAMVLGIYNGGMFAGATVGLMVGAILGYPNGFLVVGFPGLILALLCFNLRISPVRDGVQRGGRYPGTIAMMRQAASSLAAPTLRWMLVSGVLISFAVNGYITWFVDFTERFKGVSADGAAITFGIITITGGVTGVVAGGWVADRLQRRRQDGRILTIAIGFFAAVPLAVCAIYLPLGIGFYVTSWFMMFFIPWYNGPMAAVIDDVVDDHQAATAQASFTFFLHLIGSTAGGVAVGFLSPVVNLQNALMLPTVAMLASAFFCLKAARHVGDDMRARAERAARLRADHAAVA
jgi:MFS family permease